VEVAELAPGLWRWTAEHPEWEPGRRWDSEVACFYAELAAATLLLDPLVPDGPERTRFLRHLDDDLARRKDVPVAIVLTGTWHRRSAGELALRYDARVHVGDELPPGAELVGSPEGDAMVWLPELGALAVGDALISVGGELRLWGAVETPDAVRRLLELPVEHVLVAHGGHVPGGRAAVAAALERPPYA